MQDPSQHSSSSFSLSGEFLQQTQYKYTIGEGWFSFNIKMSWETGNFNLEEQYEKELSKLYYQMQQQKTTLALNKRLEDQFEQADVEILFRPIISERQKSKFKQMIEEQGLHTDYSKYLNTMTNANQKCFEPHERKAPYRENIKKTYGEMKSLYYKDVNICLSYNKYPPDFVAAFLLVDYTKEEDDKVKKGIQNLEVLYLSWVRTYRVIEFLQNKPFLKLKILNIGGNFVETIQSICHLQMPSIEELFLQSNNLIEVRSLKRANFPKLKVLDLHGNRLVDLKDLRYLGNCCVTNVLIDSNKLTNLNELVVMGSRSPKVRVSIVGNEILKYLGRPQQRRRKKAAQVEPCSLRVRYI